MKTFVLGLATGLILTGPAAAQDQGGAAKQERCAPFSRDVILGFCTKQEQADAKARIVVQNAVAARPPPFPPPKVIEGTRSPASSKKVSVALTPEDAAAVDAWIASQPDKPSRDEALHRLVQKGLVP